MVPGNFLKAFKTLVLLFLFGNSQPFAKSNETSSSSQINSKKTIVWGSGLHPDKFILQARYVFLQLVDGNGSNITRGQGKGIIHLSVTGLNSKRTSCFITTDILDCQDGSYIVRYRLHETCYSLQITIRVANAVVPVVNKYFEGPIYDESCYCPNLSIQTWLAKNECNQNDSKIFNSLEEFSSVDFDVMREQIIKRFDRPNTVSICHYVIKHNEVYRKCYGEHVGFKMFVDAILLSLTRKVILPDIEFFMNLGDWPLVPKKQKILHPIFSWCGSGEHYDIILPTYDLTESSLESMGRVMLDMLSVQGKNQIPWEEKIEKIFWRGRDSNRLRFNLIDIARENVDLFNVSMTNFFFFRDKVEKYGPGQKPIPFFEFFKFKYQVNIDGTVASYRFPYLLGGDSLVFKHHSDYHEYFYEDLEPEKHFVPVRNDLSDLVSKLKWALNNDEKARKISMAARQFARDNLMPEHVICYHAVILEEWNKRLKSKVKILPEMELVPQPKNRCKCVYRRSIRDEL